MARFQCLLRDNGNAASIAYRIPLSPSRLTFTTHRNVYIIQDPKTNLCVSNRFEEQTLEDADFGLWIVISYSVFSSWTLLPDDLRNGVVVGVSVSDNISRP